jgi:putative endonuclease
VDKQGYVYILASKSYGTLYIGVTSDLVGRVWRHREEIHPGFTSKYDVKRLVWYEVHDSIDEAIYRESQLKKWKRDWKIRLVESENPDWSDRYPNLIRN